MCERTDKPVWRCGDRTIALDGPSLIMGILNVTPDSFSDGGRYWHPQDAVLRGIQMAAEGADILDVGGESTRPGAEAVSVEHEIERVVPVIKALAAQTTVPISVDTNKAAVAEQALRAGASIVNDISAMRYDPLMAKLVAQTGAGVVLMHIRGTPRDMQSQTHYDDLVREINSYFIDALQRAGSAGIHSEQIVLDPGIGFGKTASDNFVLIRNLSRFAQHGRPILVGPSRKSFIGKALNLPVEERLEGTLAAVAACLINGASIVRVHDVGAVKRAAVIADAISGRWIAAIDAN
ncbi:dihydropteroate synthase [candidate division KSB1 bacterium]|nr:dihydropteroate synthase [candidate division KSB1 bacterium]